MKHFEQQFLVGIGGMLDDLESAILVGVLVIFMTIMLGFVAWSVFGLGGLWTYFVCVCSLIIWAVGRK